MRPSRALLSAAGLAAVLSALLPGCAAEKDVSYRKSRLLPPLNVPAGLDAPAYTQTMEIPPSAVPAPGPKDGDIEKPPAIARGQEEAAPAPAGPDAGAAGQAGRPPPPNPGQRPGEVDGGMDGPYP
jgi:hypothetical protein